MGRYLKEGLKSVEKFYKGYESSLKEKKFFTEKISDFANKSAASTSNNPSKVLLRLLQIIHLILLGKHQNLKNLRNHKLKKILN